MQNTTPTPASTLQSANVIITYGLFVLSVLAVLLIGLAWLFGRVDQTTAIDVIFIILGGNGLVTAAQWQAAPGLISQVQGFIGQLTSHIQALHAQQLTQTPTMKMAAVQPVAPVTPIPPAAPQPVVQQQPFPPASVSPSASMLGGLQSTPLNAQTWQRSVQGTGSGG